jgi:pyruvate-formate lyase-activating enzyme/ribosomal protein L37E
MTIGTAGCNFDCRYCVNAYIAKEDPASLQETMHTFTPGELVRMAQKLGCHNIVFNVNEPTMSLPSLLEVAQIAKTAGIPMGCLTNAYMTEEATEQLATVFSFFNISLKGLASSFCREYLGVPSIDPVLRNIRWLAKIGHVEIATPIIQDVNDQEIDQIAAIIAGIDREIPWHVFRLQPDYKMKEADYPNVAEINAKLERTRQVLPYIYFHNFIGSDWVNTLCPRCGAVVIERLSLGCGGDILEACHCEENLCPQCGYAIKIHGRKTDWNAKDVAL